MKKYEYQVLKINVQSSQEDVETFYGEYLNAEGEKGWQLVQIIVKEFGMYIQHSYYFIREKTK